MRYFNSIKVRLKPPVAIREITDAEFQFHKGTIKTVFKRKAGFRVTDFNSIKVRLKPGIIRASSVRP